MKGTFRYRDSDGNIFNVEGWYNFYDEQSFGLRKGRTVTQRKITDFTVELGVLHSETGPALIRDSDGFCEWYLNGEQYTKIQWLDKLGKLQ